MVVGSESLNHYNWASESSLSLSEIKKETSTILWTWFSQEKKENNHLQPSLPGVETPASCFSTKWKI